MKFVLRVDDIGWTSEPAEVRPIKKADPELALSKRFHACFKGLPWIAGVIPAALDDVGRAWLQTRPEGMTIAMHGVTHRRAEGFDSEFRSMSTSTCEALLGQGLGQLGMKTRHFIPPFNVVDVDLVPALAKTGFSVVWGQYEQAPKPPRRMGSLLFVPSFFGLYSSTLQTMGKDQGPILNNIGKYLDAPGYAVITLHLPWEHSKCDHANFEGIRELVRIVEKHVIAPEKYLEEAA